jgi:putative chitinase
MSFQVTADQLTKLSSSLKNPSAFASAINDTTSHFQIDQAPRRVRYFVAQSFYETLNFTSFEENLNYTTPARLCAVWPSRFQLDAGGPKACAADFVCNPQKLANQVYSNRNGNGDVASNDGWNYRGRGAFHLTGLLNYTSYSRYRYADMRIVQSPDLVSQPEDAFMSAGWFWQINGLSAHADKDEFTITTNIINGSTATVPERLAVLNKVNSIFQW